MNEMNEMNEHINESHTQKDCFELAKKLKHKFFYACDTGKDGGKKFYGSATNLEKFLEYYQTIDEDKKNYYELLHKDEPRYEYYDIDWDLTSGNTFSAERIIALLNSMRMNFYKSLNLEAPIPDWRITDSSKEGKISLHLINRNTLWKNSDDTKLWYKNFHNYVVNHRPDLSNLFDTAVDSNNRVMRMIGSSKFGQKRPLLPFDDKHANAPISEFFITNVSGFCDEKWKDVLLQNDEEEKRIALELKKIKKDGTALSQIKDKEDDEVEKLIELILECVKEKKHSLCDKAEGTRDKLSYPTFRNLSFGFVNSIDLDAMGEEYACNYILTEIMPFYRHAQNYSGHDKEGMIIRMIRNERAEKLITKKSLHYWARENEKYADVFHFEKIIIDDSDETLAKYIFDNLEMLYHSRKKELYVYDKESRLWILREKEWLRNIIVPILEPYFSQIEDEEAKEKCLENIKSSRKQSSILVRLSSIILHKKDDALMDCKLDKSKGLFPIRNGEVIDLKTCERRARTKDDYFTRTTNRQYRPTPAENFVREYFKEILLTLSEKYVDMLLFVIGYSLTGENNMKLFFLLLGAKDSGKSLFLQILKAIFETFAGAVNDKVFKQSRTESVHNTEAFELIEKRLAFVSELEEKESFNEQLMKKISGGDDINIRGCGSDKNITVHFDSILMLALNEIPKFNESAFAGRMRVISFKNKFRDNIARKAEILSHIDDFFSVACQFAKKYYEAGMKFDDVQEVLVSTKAIIDERDSFKTWWAEDNYQIDMTKDDPNWRVKKTSVFANYTNWCICNKVEPIGRNKFYTRFDDEFKLKTYNEGKSWCGIKEKDRTIEA